MYTYSPSLWGLPPITPPIDYYSTPRRNEIGSFAEKIDSVFHLSMGDADVICPETNPKETTKTPVTSLTSLSPLEIPQPHKCPSLASYPYTTSH